MNRQQAVEFIQALNMLQPHIAPLMFGHLATTQAVRLVTAVANGEAVCEIKPAAVGREAQRPG